MILLVVAGFARADTLVVDAAAGPYRTLAEAFGASRPGDTVQIGAGRYDVGLIWPHDLQIIGAGAGITELDGRGQTALSATGLTGSTLSGVSLSSVGGVGLALSQSVLTLSDVTIEDSGLEGGGGAIVMSGGALTVVGSSFSRNEAGRGGVIHAESARVRVSDSMFADNRASEHGGALFLVSSSLELEQVVLDGNAAETGDGGAVYVEGSTVSVVDSELLGNGAGQDGGALAISVGSDLSVLGSRFSDNTATYDGGDLTAHDQVGIVLTGTSFVDSTSSYGYGGSIYAYNNAALSATNCSWDRPYAYYGGGAFYLYYTVSPTTISDSSFVDGTALYSVGGAIYAYYYSPIVMDGVALDNNEATYSHGGAIYAVYAAPLTVTGSVLSGNLAGAGSGGAIYHEDYGTAGSTISGSTFSGNQAFYQGGALQVSSSRGLVVSDSVFRENLAGDDSFGGAIYLSANHDVRLSRNMFLLNHAGHGGAVYDSASATGAGHDAWNNNIFQENSARVGGAACVVQNGSTVLINNSFVGNAGSETAGTLCVVEQAVELINNVVAWTSAGAAIVMFDRGSADSSSLLFNDLWQNLDGDVSGPPFGTDANNLAVDPGFQAYALDADVTQDSLRLRASSPLVDAGRPDTTDPDGSRGDIGAYGGVEANNEDLDGDGVTARSDCDDEDVLVHPGATEVWYDGVDQDCDGNDDDQDGDGVGEPDDCDDARAEVAADCDAESADSGGTHDPADPSPKAEPECGCQTGRGGVSWLGLLWVCWGWRRRTARAR